MVARFQSVFYSIDLLKTMGKGKPAKKKTKVTKATRGAARRGSKTADGLRMSGDVEFDCLALDDQRAVDDFIKRMNLDIAESESSRRLRRRRSRHKIASEMIYSTYTKDMLETCLANIMVGIKRCPKSMRFINTSPGKPLSQLAPAVFNIPYLQASLFKGGSEIKLTAVSGYFSQEGFLVHNCYFPGANEGRRIAESPEKGRRIETGLIHSEGGE